MERDLRLDWEVLVREARRRRKAQGLTQKRLAAIADVSVPTVSRFENGHTDLRLTSALSILSALGLVKESRPAGRGEGAAARVADLGRMAPSAHGDSRTFLLSRLERVADRNLEPASPDGAPLLREGPVVVAYMEPLGEAPRGEWFVPSRLESLANELRPMKATGWDHRMTLDGFLLWDAPRGKPGHSYLLLFRRGVVEAACTSLFVEQAEGKFLSSVAYELELIELATRVQRVLTDLGFSAEIKLEISLLGVKGYRLPVDRFRYDDPGYSFTVDNVHLPEVVLEGDSPEVASLMKPAFDVVWQAVGWPGSLNYDRAGNWAGR